MTQRFARYWLIALVVFLLFLYVFRSILLPFVAGMAIAYALDPIADWLTRRGVKRIFAATIVMVLFIAIFLLMILAIGPILISQLLRLSADLPDYIEQLQDLMAPAIASDFAAFLGIGSGDIGQSIRDFFGNGGQVLSTFVGSLWTGGQAVAGFLSFLVVTPFVAFYLLSDWPRMIRWIDDLLPRDHADTIRMLAQQIDDKVAAFVRGQLLVGLILGVFYATGLMIIGVEFGLLIGLVAGMISFVPYLGFAVGFVLSMVVSVVQFWPDIVMPAVTIGLFLVGQFIEGYVLYPRLLGKQVGMHPVWLFFSLFAFGLLFGFVGLLIAIPAAAAVGVVASYGIQRYRASDMYAGSAGSGSSGGAAGGDVGPHT